MVRFCGRGRRRSMLYYTEKEMSKKHLKKGDVMIGKYLDPITDFGFKKLLGEEMHSNFLRDLLNELLRDETGEIVEIKYLPNEQLPDTAKTRRVIFDIYCKSERGEYFIVEMQKSRQQYFKDRSVYYSTFPIRAEAVRRLENKGDEWDYQLKPVYTICFVDFLFDDNTHGDYLHYVKLMDQKTKTVFYDKLTYVYVELKKFRKTIDELTSKLDYWIYTIKYLGALSAVPVQFEKSIFEDFFEVARVEHMTDEDIDAYSLSMHEICQRCSETKTAFNEGEAKGRKAMLDELTQQLGSTTMSPEEIEALLQRLSS